MLLRSRNHFSLTASALSLASTRGQTAQMRSPILALVLLVALLPTSGRADTPTVCFTPGQDCTDLVVSEIANAKRQILVQAYIDPHIMTPDSGNYPVDVYVTV